MITLVSGPVTAAGANVASSAMNTTGATLLVAAVGTISSNVAPFISDSAGNTWTALTSFGSGISRSRIHYVLNPTTSATHTFTALGTDTAIIVWAFTGNDPASALDQQNGLAAAGATTFQPGSCGISRNGGLVVVMATSNGVGGGPASINSGFVTPTVIAGGGSNEAVMGSYLISSGLTSVNPNVTMTANTDWAAAIASFFAPLAIGSGGGQLQHLAVMDELAF